MTKRPRPTPRLHSDFPSNPKPVPHFMPLVDNVPHPLRPSSDVASLGLPLSCLLPNSPSRSHGTFTHGAHLMALTNSVQICSLLLPPLHCAKTLKNNDQVPGILSGQCFHVTIVLLDPLRSLHERARELPLTPRQGGSRDDRFHWLMKDAATRDAAWAPCLPVLRRTTDLREVFTREIMCPWKQSQANGVRGAHLK